MPTPLGVSMVPVVRALSSLVEFCYVMDMDTTSLYLS